MADQLGENPYHDVDDLDRAARPGDPPVPGAQWDEVHRRWEHWDEATGTWVVVGDAGDGVDPAVENPLPSTLARELVHADDLTAGDEPYVDVERGAEPVQASPGAQWNEVEQRWERWDDTAAAWVPVTDGSSGTPTTS